MRHRKGGCADLISLSYVRSSAGEIYQQGSLTGCTRGGSGCQGHVMSAERPRSLKPRSQGHCLQDHSHTADPSPRLCFCGMDADKRGESMPPP